MVANIKNAIRDTWPHDKLVAVALLIAAMTADSRIGMARCKREDLFPDHTGVSDFIRLHFGLWDGNAALMESCQAQFRRCRDGDYRNDVDCVAGFCRVNVTKDSQRRPHRVTINGTSQVAHMNGVSLA